MWSSIFFTIVLHVIRSYKLFSQLIGVSWNIYFFLIFYIQLLSMMCYFSMYFCNTFWCVILNKTVCFHWNEHLLSTWSILLIIIFSLFWMNKHWRHITSKNKQHPIIYLNSCTFADLLAIKIALFVDTQFLKYKSKWLSYSFKLHTKKYQTFQFIHRYRYGLLIYIVKTY